LANGPSGDEAYPASVRARSKRSWITALSAGFDDSIRAIAASTSSAGDASPRATSSAWGVASSHAKSSAIDGSSTTERPVGDMPVRAPDRLQSMEDAELRKSRT